MFVRLWKNWHNRRSKAKKQQRPRPQRKNGAHRPTLEALEDRLVPTTTVFVDFGEGFNGSLTMRADQLRDTLVGPNLIGSGAVTATGTTAAIPAIQAST